MMLGARVFIRRGEIITDPVSGRATAATRDICRGDLVSRHDFSHGGALDVWVVRALAEMGITPMNAFQLAARANRRKRAWWKFW